MHTDFNGRTTTFAYDTLSRLLSKTPDASFNAPQVKFTYTQTGKRVTMLDVSGTTTYSYDSRDRLLTKATPQGSLSYGHDAAGNVLSLAATSAVSNLTTTVNYGYDALNRLSAVVLADSRFEISDRRRRQGGGGYLAINIPDSVFEISETIGLRIQVSGFGI